MDSAKNISMGMTEPAAALAEPVLKAPSSKIQALTTTEERFEPRLPVELGKQGSSVARPISGEVSEQVFHPGPAREQAPRGSTWWNVPIVASDSHANATTPDYVQHKDQYSVVNTFRVEWCSG
jgi:hypothetical protein